MVLFAARVSNFFTSIKEGIRGLVPLLVLLLYTIIGALIFMSIEGPNEQYELEKLQKERAQLLENTTIKLNIIKHMEPKRAKNYTERTLIEFRDALGVSDVNLNDTKWDIWGSVYYVFTVYTTIGYGNIYPETTTGRVLTIIYAFIGIPLALLSLIALGGLLAKGCLALWKFIIRASGCFSRDLQRKVEELGPDEPPPSAAEESDEDDLLRFPLSFLIFVTLCWVLISAALFLLWETDWDFGTSLYFILISFTTVGFGDVIPSRSDYILVVAFLLLVGLALISTLITIIQKQIEALASGMKGNIDKEYLKALQEAEEEELAEREHKDEESGKPLLAKKDDRSLDSALKKMPLKSRMFYGMMSADKKRQLQQHAQARLRLVNKGVQTDDYLLQTMVTYQISG